MDRRERRVAQILRDFIEAYELSAEVGAHLRATDLDFGAVHRLVGESEESALYRLKEECHALFRFDKEGTETELQAEELFDLAVGALFHEGMKFREGYYLTTSYGPRLERMMAAGTAAGPLATTFRNVIEAGRQRMLESEVEMAELFDETRDQLVILLREMGSGGAVARTLAEDADRTEEVFAAALPPLLDSIYGSAAQGYKLAVEDLLSNGHYGQARALVEREDVVAAAPFGDEAHQFSAAMEHYFSGEQEQALNGLASWVTEGARGPGAWREAAARVLENMTGNGSPATPSEGAAHSLLEKLREA